MPGWRSFWSDLSNPSRQEVDQVPHLAGHYFLGNSRSLPGVLLLSTPAGFVPPAGLSRLGVLPGGTGLARFMGAVEIHPLSGDPVHPTYTDGRDSRSLAVRPFHLPWQENLKPVNHPALHPAHGSCRSWVQRLARPARLGQPWF